MAVGRQVLQGLNHNVKHRGKGYHVQTEDLGLANPHVVTHVFAGGNVVATTRTSYAELAGAADPEAVRRLMERQHNRVLRELVDGNYDARDDALAAVARAWQPGELAPGPAPRPAGPAAPAAPDVAPPPAAAAAPPPVAAPPPPTAPPVLARAAPGGPPLAASTTAPPPPSPTHDDASLEQVLLAYLAGDHDDRDP